jgi:acetylornithine deacetylase
VIADVLCDAERRVHATIDRLEPVYRALLQRLVQTPSVSGHETEAQAIVERAMRDVGLATDTFDIDPNVLRDCPGFNATPRDYEGRPCVVGRRAPAATGGRSLVLNAHVDTVPVDDAHTWTRPPFSGEIVDGRLYGRGAADDKAAIVECLLVVHALADAGVELAGDLLLQSVIEDESTGNGSLACIARGYTGDGVIIVDGTWPERFIVSHMGHVSFQIQLTGREGHAASAGPNPLDAIGLLVSTLREFVAEKNQLRSQPWGTHARPAFVNLGRIAGGMWSSSVPASCTVHGQYGFPPPDSCEVARRELQTRLQSLGERSDWPLETAPAIAFEGLETPPVIGDPANPIAQLLSSTIARLHGATLQESIILGHCDLRHFTGATNRPTTAAILYGPGGGGGAHGRDEYFELAHLPLVAKNLASVALAWCGVGHR